MADLSNTPWDSISLPVDYSDRIATNFRIYELTKSEFAERNSINNGFSSDSELQAAIYLCRNILQPIRDEFGSFSPNSVYRGQELERGLKNKPEDWVSSSQHTKGQACDVEVPGLSTMELAVWVTDNLEYDQLICECYNPAKGVNSGWVHVSIVPPGRGDNRKQQLSYIYSANANKYVYVNGLVETA